MLFNSPQFLLFFIIVFFLYWGISNRSLKLQNILILISSYVFYAFADWRFVPFLALVSALNFFLGIYIERSAKYKKALLWIGMLEGIGILVYFKYANFFIGSFKGLFLALHLNASLMNILVPVGISFFTFRILSYLQDIYKGKIKATTDCIIFFNYVAFFPCLLAGPIDKAKHFIPQLERKRTFNYALAVDGARQILWGLFKKMVVADNCALLTEGAFDNYQNLPGSTLLISAFLYAVQIYADFSGYSDMAIGFGKLLGFNVTQNFNYPYFSQNIAEFWRKWHISLTSWLTEYLFTPLNIAVRDFGKVGIALAIIINFTIIGMWHGANWTYILFGFVHGCYFIPLIIKGTVNKKKVIAKDKLLPSIKEAINVLVNCFFVMLTFVLFRSPNISAAFHYYRRLFSKTLFSFPVITQKQLTATSLLFLTIMFLVEWVNRNKEFGLQIDHVKKPFLRSCIYCLLILCVIFFSATQANQFIYFKF